MGRISRQVGDAALFTGVMSMTQGVARVASVWWLMPPITAVYHVGTLVAILSGRPALVLVVMLAEAGWTALAAAHGRRDGNRERAITAAAMEWGAEQPHLLGSLRGPARGHALALGLCWITAPLQTAAYRTAWDQARQGITAADLRGAYDAARAERAPIKPSDQAPTTQQAAATTEQPTTAPAAPLPAAGAFLGFDPSTGAAVRANPRGACLVIGPPGSGKTDGVIAPSVATAPGPVVSTSIKWDVLTATVEARRARGTVWAYDPGGDEAALPDGVTAVHWSPLDSVYDWESALTVAARLRQALPDANDPRAAHWLDRAQDWAAVLLYAASLRGVEELMRWARRPRAATDEIRAVLEANPGEDSDMATDALAAVVDDTEDRERSGVESTMSRLWAVYKLPGGVRTAKGTNFSPAEFVKSAADTLYIAVPAERTNVYAPAVVALLEAIRFEQYRRYADLAKSETPSSPVTFVLDEVANTAPVDVPAIASEAGGQRLHLVIALQDLAQARHRWGQDRGGGLLTIVGTKALLPGIVDPSSLEAISLAIGDYQRGQLTESIGDDGRRSTSYGQTRERSIPPSRIARLAHGRVIVVEGARPREIDAARWHVDSERVMKAAK
ncbi:type IV secretory system conjugative DNA transfer family protein [Mycolicibacterium iranicum]|uniref:Type IV secretory system conjugative DNA transfer family protein n=1 Tax=Mycolicibacterium iranicum TaxID=912594 RepID=A0ABT4HQL5_MYCIR|nr:type IV secretory system conjugative DNA transfer family protein [Mycolicibacterium iranicum]MCZ0732496.1 type IV secretory system conjugative DNA transfer family protein [Mycolicibacterium iranicum]